MKQFLNYWTYATSAGDFSIVERHSRGVDLYFGRSFIAHYSNPVAAAEDAASGKHPAFLRSRKRQVIASAVRRPQLDLCAGLGMAP
jgi:hypothetical protein